MTAVLLIIHLFVTLALIGVVLIQRSEGGGLGIGTSQGMGAFMSGRGTANLLTRTTAILGTIFFGLSLTLALMNRGTAGVGHSLLDTLPAESGAPPGLPGPPTPNAPATPLPAPSAPSGSAPVANAPATTGPATNTPSAPAPEAPATESSPAAQGPTTGSAPATPAPAAPRPSVPTN